MNHSHAKLQHRGVISESMAAILAYQALQRFLGHDGVESTPLA